MNQQRTISLRVTLMEGQQFLVFDKGWDWADSADALWNEQSLFRHVGAAQNRAIVVMTAGETVYSVPVTILIGSGPPEESDLKAWDHIVEVNLRCESGILQIGEGRKEDTLVPLPSAGSYRVRVSMANLDSANDDPPSDSYAIELWPHPEEEPYVIKWWEPWRPLPAPPLREDRRTIYGIDNYRGALKDLALAHIASREIDPAPELQEYLPASYKETLFLFQAKDGTYWEYSTVAPHHLPLLTELTTDEARERYGLQ